ncbi:MAG: hypothetical protein CM1200mP31_5980 [Candidatus Neomarinimicrobiota bacterium]|nr:MAG: hypothetical protein CM1200mP31_5980 [Candidatus Neomarinimicrobiota bacterium]
MILLLQLISGKSLKPNKSLKKIVEIMSRVRDLSVRHLNEYLLNQADFVFHPDHDSLHWSAFDRTDDFIKNGHDCAKKEIENLIHKLDSFGEVDKRFLKKLFGQRLRRSYFPKTDEEIIIIILFFNIAWSTI